MRSNLFFIILSLFAFCSCGGSSKFGASSQDKKNANAKVLISTETQTFFVTAYSSYNGDSGLDQDQIMSVDKFSKKLNIFRLNPFRLERFMSIDLINEKTKISSGRKGDFIFVINEEEYAIIGKDGAVKTNPVELAGNIVGSSYHSNENIFVVYDDLGSVGLLKLSDIGEVDEHWVGEPFLKSTARIESVTALRSGKLLFVLSSGDFALVDTVASIANKKWTYTEFSLKAGGDDESKIRVQWVAETVEKDNVLLVLSQNNSLVTYDMTTQTVIDEMQINEPTYIGAFYQDVPHVLSISNDDANEKMLFCHTVLADGTIFSQPVISGSRMSHISQSYLSTESGELTFIENVIEGKGQELSKYAISRYRIEDSLAVFSRPITLSGKVAVTPSYIFLQYNSPLGYVERRDYLKAANTQEIKGFNIGIGS